MEKYTFLLPAYKGRFLREAIDSILGQTYGDFRLIISDDCSPEDLGAIVGEYDDPRITFRRNEENMGSRSLVGHWNLLVGMAETEYMILASDDDVYDPTFLEEMDRLAQKYPQADLLHARARVIDANGEVTQEDALYEEFVSQVGFQKQYYLVDHVPCIPNHVFKTDALKKRGGFIDTPLAWTADTITTLILAKNGVANTKDILFSFRMSGENISSIGYDIQVERKKMEATMIYDDMVMDILRQVKIGDSLLEKRAYNFVVRSHIGRTGGELCYFSRSLPFAEFIRFVKKYRKRGYVPRYEVYVLIKKWLYFRVRRK